MSFIGYADPAQLKLLSQALSEYCRANGIEENTASYDEAAELVVLLFQSGISSVEALSRALATKRSPDRSALRA